MNVLFVHFGDDWLAGSEIALLEMLKQFPRDEVTPTLWCNGRQMAAAAEALGVRVIRDDFALYFHYGSPPLSLPRYLASVRKGGELIAETGADLVHCNSGAPAQWMITAARRRGVPVLVNSHSPYIKRGRYTMGLHLADRIVAVASAIAQPLLADGMDPTRISVVYNGFDEKALMQGEAAGLRRGLGIPADAIVGAVVGNMIRRKGHDVLFEAMRLRSVQDLPFHLLVIGDGPMETGLRAMAEGLPINFLGRRSDVGAVLRDAADILIAPSREEAFGRVIVEGAFASLPAIGSNVDGIPEAIADGETGVLVDPESPEALASAISALSTDADLRTRLGAAARERARRLFSIEAGAGQMVEEYRLAIERYNVDRTRPFELRRLRPYARMFR